MEIVMSRLSNALIESLNGMTARRVTVTQFLSVLENFTRLTFLTRTGQNLSIRTLNG